MLSREDSASMEQLARDSKEVALRTYKDSISMRLMAIVNLCTMPGTFTAVRPPFPCCRIAMTSERRWHRPQSEQS